MVTPFDDDNEVDYDKAKRLALALVESGSDGVVVVGTTGESPALNKEEQARMFAEVADALKGKGTVLAGAGSNNTIEAVHYTKDAEDAGADGVLHVVPYYNKPTQEGLYQHFKTIAGSTDLPVVLYNVPSRTIVNMSADTTIRLSKIPNIVGIKEASGNIAQVTRIVSESRDDFLVWSGNDGDTFPILALGGYGVVSVASHLVGLQIREMINKFVEGDVEESARIHSHLLPLVDSLFIVSNPIPVKYALKLVGFDMGKPRLPLTEPDEKTAIAIAETLKKFKIDLPVPVSS
jgi:4-hydroxy-tetrahydrodipicolinate synthase